MIPATTQSGSKNLLFQNIIEKEIVGSDNIKTDVDKTRQIETPDMEAKAAERLPQARPTTKTSHPVPLKNYATGQTFYDTLHATEAADTVRLNAKICIVYTRDTPSNSIVS